MASKNNHCLNCGNALIGEFCHHCGQEKANINLGFIDLVRELIGELITYDSRVYRTIVPLLIRPGQITHDFFIGRRARYVPPVRLYLFVSFILFFWLAMTDSGVNVDSDNTNETNNLEFNLSRDDDGEVPTWLAPLAEKLSTNWELIKQNPNSFLDILASRLPHLMFLLLPVFALITWLHFCLSGFNFLQHLVFALHFHAFVYTFILLISITRLSEAFDSAALVLLFSNVYLALAMRKAFGSSKLGCALKTISTLCCYLTCLVFGILGFLIVNVMSFA